MAFLLTEIYKDFLGLRGAIRTNGLSFLYD